MSSNKYNNFVRPASPNEARITAFNSSLNGEEAKKLYLEEVKDIGDPERIILDDTCDQANNSIRKRLTKCKDKELSDHDLFLSVQNNNIDVLQQILDNAPDKINILDSYGWSLLMIACQANSIDVVRELLKRDIDTSIRDKAGNSANTLVIKNKNRGLADLLLAYKKMKNEDRMQRRTFQKNKRLREEYTCEKCNKTYPDKEEHLSSTIHNITASKGKKIPASYVIPTTNKGYQLMLKGGWDRESGLGPNGSGRRNPIKAVEKRDRKGLGNKKKEIEIKYNIEPTKDRTCREREDRYYKRLEAKFRREFYWD